MRDIVIWRASFGVGKNGKPKMIGRVRQLPPPDPRSLDHPSHKDQWLELARAFGRLEAREELERMKAAHPPGTTFVLSENYAEDTEKAIETYNEEYEARRRY